MIFENAVELKERAEEMAGRKVYSKIRINEDTSNFMIIDGGSVLRLEGNDYFILGAAKEGRFGISEQPKPWVKYAVDLTDGSRKVIKLVFHENFSTKLGMFKIRCARDPDKESAVLDAVNGDCRFMQGFTIRDPKGNNVRIVDFIRGKTFFNEVLSFDQDHEEYYYETLPTIMRQLVGCIEALGYLRSQGLEHGDVRNDHVIIESGTRRYRWIDFDYTVNYGDYDVWSMGNLLCYALAKGIVTFRSAKEMTRENLTSDDALLFYRYRVANLRKIYPYIDPALNDLIMRFSGGTSKFFQNFEEMASSVRSAYGRAWGRRVSDRGA
ncbi:MAG: hypothetical protein HN348_00600 [Proteobacteria bacterium]|nr:hypothetical protein [Pseudomonadota bacterium]